MLSRSPKYQFTVVPETNGHNPMSTLKIFHEKMKQIVISKSQFFQPKAYCWPRRINKRRFALMMLMFPNDVGILYPPFMLYLSRGV